MRAGPTHAGTCRPSRHRFGTRDRPGLTRRRGRHRRAKSWGPGRGRVQGVPRATCSATRRPPSSRRSTRTAGARRSVGRRRHDEQAEARSRSMASALALSTLKAGRTNMARPPRAAGGPAAPLPTRCGRSIATACGKAAQRRDRRACRRAQPPLADARIKSLAKIVSGVVCISDNIFQIQNRAKYYNNGQRN